MNNRDSRNQNNYNRHRDNRRGDDPYYQDEGHREDPYYRNDPYYGGRPPKRRSILSYLFSGIGLLFVVIVLIGLFSPSEENESAKPERIEQDTATKANEEDEYLGDAGVEDTEEDEYLGDTGVEDTEEDVYLGDMGVEETVAYEDFENEIQSTLDYYLAIYDNRNIDLLSEAVYASSSFYNEQYKYMESLNERGIVVYLNDYSVQSIKNYGANKYVAVVNEDYTIDNPESGVKDVIQRSEYTFKVIDGIFYIIDMKIK